MYEPRFYREWIKDKDLVSFNVTVKETDLYISAHSDLKTQAVSAIINCRNPLEEYIKNHPVFLTTLEPYPVDDNAPAIVKEMAQATGKMGVGPMAAVAGAIAAAVGKALLAYSPEVIVENGGDIYMKITRKRLVGIYAGDKSPFTGKIALEIQPDDTPLGICTSSKTVGPSLSFGETDATIVVSPSAALADAAATAIGNRVKSYYDIDKEIEQVHLIAGLTGVVIIKDDRIGIWGNIKIVPL